MNQTVDRIDEDNVQTESVEADKIQKSHDVYKKYIENYEIEYVDGNTGEEFELTSLSEFYRIFCC